MRTATWILRALAAEGLGHVFLVPGGLVDPFLTALTDPGAPRAIVAAHEAGAAFMADGYARASGRFGACLAIGGPGVTNMVTAVASAKADSSPLCVLSGQVPTEWEGRGGFQDSSPSSLNDPAILAPVTALSLAVENVHLVPHHLRAALTRMLAGPGQPVHLSLPTDIQRAETAAAWVPLDQGLYAPRLADDAALARLWDLLAPGDGRPPTRLAILAGAGVEKSGATPELLALAERYAIPVATTLRAKGVFPEDHPLSLGVFGYAGHRPAIELILSGGLEVLFVVGSGLGQRDTMFWNRDMLPKKALVHVDIDPAVPGRTFPTEAPLVGDAGEVLRRIMLAPPAVAEALEAGVAARRTWLGDILAAGPRRYDAETRDSLATPLHPAFVAATLRRVLPRQAAVAVDSGAHRAFFAHHFEAYGPRTYFTATNLGPMGWAVPAAVGIKAALPDTVVAAVAGDGCMLMHGIETQTAARYDLPVVFVVINNAALGNVWLRAVKEGPGQAALTELPRHDWAMVARGLGLSAETVERPEDLEPALERAVASKRACLVDVWCDRTAATPVGPYARAKAAWVDED